MGDLPGREQFSFWVPVSVRWGDMDSYGHVNNAKYFTYCETARMAYFEAIGIDGATSQPDLGPAIVRAECNFRHQVRHPAELDIGVRTSKIGGRTFTLEYGLFHRGTDDLAADGASVCVWVDYVAEKALPIPEALIGRIRQLEDAS
ncbi:MAG: acyl-CoA thioesterase [Thermoanaerobaculia bacterium]|nr:acyl-CoA thioesterase [Thermoanaerobaculia bacterium]